MALKGKRTMIKRIVLLKLKDSPEPMAQLSALAEATIQMFKEIPQALDVKVSRGTAETAVSSWDVMLEVRFANETDAAAYMHDPMHLAYIKQVLEPVVEFKKAWNFHIMPDVGEG